MSRELSPNISQECAFFLISYSKRLEALKLYSLQRRRERYELSVSHVILIYRPPSCSGPQFEDVILKMKSVMFKLASPLPNIIMLGDFNLPTMSWSQPGDCFISRVFCPFVK